MVPATYRYFGTVAVHTVQWPKCLTAATLETRNSQVKYNDSCKYTSHRCFPEPLATLTSVLKIKYD
jgi:hypothetical protein